MSTNVAGFVFERLGQPDRALRYYEEALEDADLGPLGEAVVHTAARATYRGPQLLAYLASDAANRFRSVEPGPEDSAEILTVISLGRVPYKVPKRIRVGAAVGIAGTHVSGDPKWLALSALKLVVYPELEQVPSVYRGRSVHIDGNAVPTTMLTDLGAEIANEYGQIKPKIIGAALTRMIARAAKSHP